MTALNYLTNNIKIISENYNRELIINMVKELIINGWVRDKSRDYQNEQRNIIAVSKGIETIWLGKCYIEGKEHNFIMVEDEESIKSNFMYVKNTWIHIEKYPKMQDLKAEKKTWLKEEKFKNGKLNPYKYN